MFRSLLALAVLVVSLTAALADSKKTTEEKPPADKPDAKTVAAQMAEDEKALIDLLNKTRAKAKLPTLVLNPLLCKAAKAHTENMAKQEKMEHVLDGKGVKHRVVDAGYAYRKVGENLAKAAGDPDLPAPAAADIHDHWMKSKNHRANIMEPKYT